MKKRHKLQNTVLSSFALLATVLILIITFVVGDQYIRKEMENCRSTAYSYTKSAAELIDGDKIAHYLETELYGNNLVEITHIELLDTCPVLSKETWELMRKELNEG